MSNFSLEKESWKLHVKSEYAKYASSISHTAREVHHHAVSSPALPDVDDISSEVKAHRAPCFPLIQYKTQLKVRSARKAAIDRKSNQLWSSSPYFFGGSVPLQVLMHIDIDGRDFDRRKSVAPRVE